MRLCERSSPVFSVYGDACGGLRAQLAGRVLTLNTKQIWMKVKLFTGYETLCATPLQSFVFVLAAGLRETLVFFLKTLIYK